MPGADRLEFQSATPEFQTARCHHFRAAARTGLRGRAKAMR